jgi:hypothetical protein
VNAVARFAFSSALDIELELRARSQATKRMCIPGVAGLLLGDQLWGDFDLPGCPALPGNSPSAPK